MLRQTSSHLQYSSRSDYSTKHKHEGHVGGCLPFDCASIADLALSPAGLSRHQRWPEEARQRLGRQRSLHILLALPTMCHPRFPRSAQLLFLFIRDIAVGQRQRSAFLLRLIGLIIPIFIPFLLLLVAIVHAKRRCLCIRYLRVATFPTSGSQPLAFSADPRKAAAAASKASASAALQ